VNLFVDTSVWSLALRRDTSQSSAEVTWLAKQLTVGTTIFTSGLVLQDLFQGFRGPKQRDLILERFTTLPLIVPDLDDHIEAAALRNRCRKKGIQVGTIDALLAWLCIRNELSMLSTDQDFLKIASLFPLDVIRAK
jgi:hypothetical protein